MKLCETCMWWGWNKHDSTDSTGGFRYCRHPKMSEQDMVWARVYDDCGEIAVLVHKTFGCIGYETPNQKTEV
ncbi:hypothetical protein LCGC14_2275540 [marine sediment metagenome]|uniref:Uncharacterized protein n=1 Tax=marine sediment metagenome TaxID=412755 RepID=A0A0F9F878_9ZZZZ